MYASRRAQIICEGVPRQSCLAGGSNKFVQHCTAGCIVSLLQITRIKINASKEIQLVVTNYKLVAALCDAVTNTVASDLRLLNKTQN